MRPSSRNPCPFVPDRLRVASLIASARRGILGFAWLQGVDLREAIEHLQRKHVACQVHVHIDAAGQYATNLERKVLSRGLWSIRIAGRERFIASDSRLSRAGRNERLCRESGMIISDVQYAGAI